jgi:hypothetical protein
MTGAEGTVCVCVPQSEQVTRCGLAASDPMWACIDRQNRVSDPVLACSLEQVT